MTRKEEVEKLQKDIESIDKMLQSIERFGKNAVDIYNYGKLLDEKTSRQKRLEYLLSIK